MAAKLSRRALLPLLGLLFVVSPGCERNWGGADTTPPTIVQARWVDDTHADIEFDEEVEQSSAETKMNYSITTAEDPSDVLSVVDARLQPDQKTVRLTTSSQQVGITYTVEVANVQDLAGNPLPEVNVGDFTNGTVLTYEGDIQPVLEAKCIMCHGSGGFAPLTTYDEVMVFVNNGTLEEKAEGGHQAFDETSSQLVIDWINAGAHER